MKYVNEIAKIRVIFKSFMSCTINDKQADAIYNHYGSAEQYKRFLVGMMMNPKADRLEQRHLDWLVAIDEQ